MTKQPPGLTSVRCITAEEPSSRHGMKTSRRTCFRRSALCDIAASQDAVSALIDVVRIDSDQEWCAPRTRSDSKRHKRHAKRTNETNSCERSNTASAKLATFNGRSAPAPTSRPVPALPRIALHRRRVHAEISARHDGVGLPSLRLSLARRGHRTAAPWEASYRFAVAFRTPQLRHAGRAADRVHDREEGAAGGPARGAADD